MHVGIQSIEKYTEPLNFSTVQPCELQVICLVQRGCNLLHVHPQTVQINNLAPVLQHGKSLSIIT